MFNQYFRFQIIQVTPMTARLVKIGTKNLVSEWKPPGDKRIGVVACNLNQLVCASACEVYYIEIKDGQLVEKCQKTLDYEVACLDITPIGDENTKAHFVAVGLWTNISAVILNLPELNILYTEKLGGGNYNL